MSWGDGEFESVCLAIAAITRDFENLDCKDCARAVLLWLSDNGYEGQLLRLQTGWGEDFIMSRRLEENGIDESITENGTHYGVRFGDRVFDNLSEVGLSLEEWLADFQCQSGEILLDELNNWED
jgi:hypothetical protein